MRFFVLAIMLFMLGISAQAQQSETTVWHWAVDNDTNELFAYAPTGEVNLIASNVNAIQAFGAEDFWRVDEEESVGFATIDSEYHLYILDSTSAQAVEPTFDEELWQYYADSAFILEPTAYAYPYMALTASVYVNERLRTRPALLLNLDTRQLHLLSENSQEVMRFSGDGQRLRYSHITMGNEVNVEIREYDVASNTESILYAFQEDLSDAVIRVEDADIYGERWLISRSRDLYVVDGWYRLFSTATLAVETLYTFDTDEAYQRFKFINDDLLTYPAECSQDCILTLQTSDRSTFTYSTTSYAHFYRSQSNDLIVDSGMYYQIDTDGNVTLLGILHVSGSGLPSSLSPDRRYALLADSFPSPNDIWMMDFYTNERLFTFPSRAARADILFTNYFIDGFIVDSFEGARLFKYGEDTHIRLPNLGFGAYFAMLPDDTVLHYARNQITHYDPATDEQAVLLDNVRSIRDISIELIVQRLLSS